MVPNILAVGASKNIGYFAAVRLLEQGATVTFILRTPSVFDTDPVIQRYLKSGKARLVKGDASRDEDTRRAWEEAGAVDALIFSVGSIPKLDMFKGFVMDPPNPVTKCLLSVFCTMPKHTSPPKIIIFSSIGLTPAGHAALPALLKPLYGVVLAAPHRDKIGVERVVAHCAGWAWDPAVDGVVEADILADGWTTRAGLPEPGSLTEVLVVRPALLTDGKCKADERAAKGKGKMYRVGEGELGGYTISRKDAAHFVVNALSRWDEFRNKRVNVSY
ncbi:hypothetical protein B0H19DRAFT_916713 [Mycena capillaripes]|nr:hypothetical protein B0H19DRAFT_916713 [Mycena capillaripes]